MAEAVHHQPTVQVVTTQVVSSGGAHVVGGREWSSGVFGCFDDMKSCLCGLLFPICLACRISKRLDEHCCVPLCNGGIVALRVKTRMLFGIRGDICNDYCTSCVLTPCVLCQMSRELDAAGWHS